MVKIRSFDLGIQFHDALKYLNNTAFHDYTWRKKFDMRSLKHHCKIIAIMLFNDINTFKDLDERTNEVVEKAIEIIKEYAEDFEKCDYSIYNMYKSDKRTISTELISAFGYEGVDCRGVEGLDNTMYGSVIYKLKNGEK